MRIARFSPGAFAAIVAGLTLLSNCGGCGSGGGTLDSGGTRFHISFQHVNRAFADSLGNAIVQRDGYGLPGSEQYNTFTNAASWETFLATYGLTPVQFPNIDFTREQVAVAVGIVNPCTSYGIERIQGDAARNIVTIHAVQRHSGLMGEGCAVIHVPVTDMVIFAKQRGYVTFRSEYIK
jgi:hypothetical protein